MQSTNAGKKWTPEENDQLLKLYNIDKLDVNQIATIHGRKTGGIASRLVVLKIVDDVSKVRGYNASDEYKQKLNDKIKGEPVLIEKPKVCNECFALQEKIKKLEEENTGLQSDLVAINKVLATVTELL